MATVLTPEQIESVVATLPPQGRVMLRLLLLQYLDLTPEDIEFIAKDGTDPRMLAGVQTKVPAISRETLQGIADRVEQYRSRIRQKRGRVLLQIECLQKQIEMTETLCTVSERLLTTRFGLSQAEVQELKQTARTAVASPLLRDLARKWDQEAISEEDYLKGRLRLDYQAQLRRLDRQRRRLDTVKREVPTLVGRHLQDHEIAHIWGLPMGSLAARKVKFVQKYLEQAQTLLGSSPSTTPASATAPVDLWKETFAVLAQKPIERMVTTYDNIEGMEEAFMEKLTTFANGGLSEEVENRFWQLLILDTRPGAEHGSKQRSLFGLQRLSAILAEIDSSPEALEADLWARITPKPKAAPEEEMEPAPSAEPQLTEMQEHILRSLRGE